MKILAHALIGVVLSSMLILTDVIIGVVSAVILLTIFLLVRRQESENSTLSHGEAADQESQSRAKLSILVANPFETKLYRIDERLRTEVLEAARNLSSIEARREIPVSSLESWMPAVSSIHLALNAILIKILEISSSISIITLMLLPLALYFTTSHYLEENRV